MDDRLAFELKGAIAKLGIPKDRESQFVAEIDAWANFFIDAWEQQSDQEKEKSSQSQSLVQS